MSATNGVSPPALHIIIPVKNMAGHIAQCLPTLTSQLSDGDRVTIVDDGSSDDIAGAVTDSRVELLRVSGGRGPYAARHAVASESAAELLLFVDARCRARPGLLDAHRTLLRVPNTALSTTETNTMPGDTFAGRIAGLQQPFALKGKIGATGRLDFYPTANLGVVKSAYDTVGGFREMRSGADADLCWRIQLEGLGGFGVSREVLMDWVPRATWSELKEQWTRYGESTALLEQVFPGQSPAGAANDSGLAGRLRTLTGRFGATPVRQWGVVAGTVAAHLAFMRGYRNGKARPRAAAPQLFTTSPDLSPVPR
jgi:glycosyltransferase involved in cell wall biosynthesis